MDAIATADDFEFEVDGDGALEEDGLAVARSLLVWLMTVPLLLLHAISTV